MSSWKSGHAVPILQRGVHPLLLEALAVQPLDPKTALLANIKQTGDKPVRLCDLTVRQVVELVIKPATVGEDVSYMEALYSGDISLPAHPMAPSPGSSYFKVEELSQSYQGYDAENLPVGTTEAVQVSTTPVFMVSSSTLPSGQRSQGQLSRGSTGMSKSNPQPSLLSQTSNADLQTSASQSSLFYVCHSWGAKFGQLVQLVKGHYEAQIWAAMTAAQGKEQGSPSFQMQHKQQSWQVKNQAPMFYFIDILCLNLTDTSAESLMEQGGQYILASCNDIVVAVSPSVSDAHVTQCFTSLFEILMVALLQRSMTVLLPDLRDPTALTQTKMCAMPTGSKAELELCPRYDHRCAQQLKVFEKTLSTLDLAKAETNHADDRDFLLEVIKTWAADLDPSCFADGVSAPNGKAPAGKSTARQWKNGLDMLLDVVRARLRAGAAEALFWGHLLSKYKLNQVVWSNSAMATRNAWNVARAAPSATSKRRAEYATALDKHEPPAAAGRNVRSSTTAASATTSGGMFSKALSAVNNLLSPTTAKDAKTAPAPSKGLATISAPIPSTQPAQQALGVQWEVTGHIETDVATLLIEARRGSAAVAQVPVRCTCKCASCTSHLQSIMAVNATPGPSVYEAAGEDVSVRGGLRQLYIPAPLPDSNPNGPLASYFPLFAPPPKDLCSYRADQLMRRAKAVANNVSTNGIWPKSGPILPSLPSGPRSGPASSTGASNPGNGGWRSTEVFTGATGPRASVDMGADVANMVLARALNAANIAGKPSMLTDGSSSRPMAMSKSGNLMTTDKYSVTLPGTPEPSVPSYPLLPKVTDKSKVRLSSVICPGDLPSGYFRPPSTEPCEPGTTLPTARSSQAGALLAGMMGGMGSQSGKRAPVGASTVLLVSVPMLTDHDPLERQPNSGGLAAITPRDAPKSNGRTGMRAGMRGSGAGAVAPARTTMRFEDMLGPSLPPLKP